MRTGLHWQDDVWANLRPTLLVQSPGHHGGAAGERSVSFVHARWVPCHAEFLRSIVFGYFVRTRRVEHAWS